MSPKFHMKATLRQIEELGLLYLVGFMKREYEELSEIKKCCIIIIASLHNIGGHFKLISNLET